MGRPKKRPRTGVDPTLDSQPSQAAGYLQPWEAMPAQANDHDRDGAHGNIPLDAAFTPRGALQPYFQASSADWNENLLLPDADPSNDHAGSLPTLTRENRSSHSPSMLDAGLEGLHHRNPSTSHRDPSTALLLSPDLEAPLQLSHLSSGSPPKCACLSTLYLTLNSLQSMDHTFAFPFALHPLREAMTTATEVLACPECPTRFVDAIINTQLLGTLFVSIAERFSKVLRHITSEASRAKLVCESKRFRLADLNTSTSHLHVGGLGCAAAFEINLTPDEWRSMCKKVVRAEVYGPEDGNQCCCFFVGVLQQMEERQLRWHASSVRPDDCPRDLRGQPVLARPATTITPPSDIDPIEQRPCAKKEDHLCLKLVGYARELMEAFDWSG